MTVYRVMVDDLLVWGNAWGPFTKGSCHLTVDGEGEEALTALHAFAAKIGMRRSWFQDHPKMPHYDLTPARRERALREGAVYISARDQVRARRARRGRAPGGVTST